MMEVILERVGQVNNEELISGVNESDYGMNGSMNEGPNLCESRSSEI